MSEALRSLWNWWKRVGKRIGDFQARILLSVFYYFILAPFALVVRWVSDPLAIKSGTERGWRPRVSERTQIELARRQF